MRPSLVFSLLLALALVAPPARGEGLGLTVKLPDGSKAASAVAVARELELESAGKVDGRDVTFSDLLPDTPYDVRVTLEDGTVLHGVDLGWYNEEADDEAGDEAGAAEPEDDDGADNSGHPGDEDRQQIQDILNVPRFYNKCDILALGGDRKRATALVRLVRDTDFYAGAGQIIWRIELWYFKNQFGGWEAVSQQNKILRRERFKSKQQYEAETRKIRWTPQFGGVRLSEDQPSAVVELKELPAEAPKGKDAKSK